MEMRDFGSSEPKQIYEALTRRLAQKLSRDDTPEIGVEDVAALSDLLHSDQIRSHDTRFWMSLHSDGTVIDCSKGAITRLGLREEALHAPDLAAQLRSQFAIQAIVQIANRDGQMILCSATRAASDQPWLVQELTFQVNDGLGDCLRQLWGFSPGETAIALALLGGEGPADIAQRTGRTLGTVRQGVKAILTKMQAPTQAKAVSKLALIAADRQIRQTTPPLQNVARRVAACKDATGAPLHYWRFGVPGGVPVLLLHGALFGVFSNPDLVRAAELFGLDIIAPERPGYGQTPLPDGHDPVALSVARAHALLRIHGMTRAHVVAQDVGTAYAFAFARSHPDCVSSLICAPATPPMLGWAQTADMPPLHRVSAFITQKAPGLMEQVIKLGLRRAAREGLKAIPEMLFADSAHDRAVLQRAEAYPVLENLYLSVTDQEGAGFLQDMFITNLNWSAWLPDIQCPVRFIHGAQSRTVSRAALQKTSEALSDARLDIIEECGHTLPVTHPEHMLRPVLRLD